jgi:hypothetical protein
MFNDQAKAIRQQFLRASATEVASASKLEKAKQYLGSAWVLSPEYNRTNNPAHAAQDSYCLQYVRAAAVLDGRI